MNYYTPITPRRFLTDCPICGLEFEVELWRIKKGQGKFCSKPCFDIAQTTDRIADFWKNVNKTEACWLWTAGLDKDGYGKYYSKPKYVRAHRFSYELHKGEIPEGSIILHTCDNPTCVNPEHLLAGTLTDNNRDTVAKGRWKNGITAGTYISPVGESAPNVKLSTLEISTIRELYSSGKYTQSQIGDLFNLHQGTISAIILYKTRKNG